MQYTFRLVMLVLCVTLAACQSTQNNSFIIAKTFKLSTGLQQKLMDRYQPKYAITVQTYVYQQQPKLSLDVYQRTDIAQSERPTILWIHGGGWITGSKDHARGYFKRLADAGINVVAIEYQFAPRYIYPTQLNQVNAALDFIQRHHVDLKLNVNQLYLAGDSAGANLASHYAALLTNPDFAQQSNFVTKIQPKQLKGLILHCGIYDLATFVEQAPDELKIVEWAVYNLVQAYTGDRKDDTTFLKSISPIDYITSDYPPVLMSGGNKDFLTETQSMPMLQKLKAEQVRVMPVFYPHTRSWLIHEYQFFMHQKEAKQTFEQTLRFIEQTKAE